MMKMETQNLLLRIGWCWCSCPEEVWDAIEVYDLEDSSLLQ
jgi:hypothetical protein